MSDTLSLPLPKASTRRRVKIKRPRKPTLAEAWWLCWSASSFVLTLIDAIWPQSPALYWIVYFSVCTGGYWNAYRRCRRGVAPHMPLRQCWLVIGMLVFGLVAF